MNNRGDNRERSWRREDEDRYRRDERGDMRHGQGRYEERNDYGPGRGWGDERRRDDRGYNEHGYNQRGRHEHEGRHEGHGRYDDRRGAEHDHRSHEDRGGLSYQGGRPRREGPYRGPSMRDDYEMYREGNYAGYESWHGHGDGLRYSSQGGQSGRDHDDRGRHERRGHEQYDDHQGHRGGGYRAERRHYESPGRQDDRHHHDDRHRYDNRERHDDRGRQSGENQPKKDISGMWRQFGEWDNTSYGDSRSQGIGWHRGDEYGDSFWSFSERSRNDRR